MSEVKWIKITTDMFEDEKIDFIESLPESDSIIVMWVRLLTLAGKCNSGGSIFLTETIPYTDEMLAHKFRKPINTVRLALDTFSKLGMIETTIQGLYITNWNKHQNIEGLEKIRVQNKLRAAKYRENKKLLKESNVTNNVTVTQSNGTELDIDKELELDIDIDKSIEPKKIIVKKEVSKEKPYTHDFEEFYNLYPNGFNKAQTFKNWKALLKTETKENILLATNNYLKYIADNKTEKQFITRSTNFIGQHQDYLGYLDYKDVVTNKKVEVVNNGNEELSKMYTRKLF